MVALRQVFTALAFGIATVIVAVLSLRAAASSSDTGFATAQTPPLLLEQARGPRVGERAESSGTELLERPLFSPSRRAYTPPVVQPVVIEPVPPPEPVALPVVEPPPTARPVLLGVFITEAQTKALLTFSAGAEAAWVVLGGEVNGWTVEAIEKESVTVSSSVETVHLQLHVDKATIE